MDLEGRIAQLENLLNGYLDISEDDFEKHAQLHGRAAELHAKQAANDYAKADVAGNEGLAKEFKAGAEIHKEGVDLEGQRKANRTTKLEKIRTLRRTYGREARKADIVPTRVSAIAPGPPRITAVARTGSRAMPEVEVDPQFADIIKSGDSRDAR